MPRADMMCGIRIVSNPVPTATNPLGAKGAGEAGCVGALPAVMIAVMNALEPLGVQRTRHAGDQRACLAGDPEARATTIGSAQRRLRCEQGRNTAERCATAAASISSARAWSRMSRRTRPPSRWWTQYVAWYDRHFDPAWQDVVLTPPDANGERSPWATSCRAAPTICARMGRCFSATCFLTAGNITHTPAYGHMIALGVLHAVGLRNASAQQVDERRELSCAYRRNRPVPDVRLGRCHDRLSPARKPG